MALLVSKLTCEIVILRAVPVRIYSIYLHVNYVLIFLPVPTSTHSNMYNNIPYSRKFSQVQFFAKMSKYR